MLCVDQKHLIFMLKNFSTMLQLCEQYYFGYSKGNFRNHGKFQPIAQVMQNGDSYTKGFIFGGRQYQIKTEELFRGPKAIIIRILRTICCCITPQNAQLGWKMMQLLKPASDGTMMYYPEYFKDLEDILQMCLGLRLKNIEMSHPLFRKTVVVQALDQTQLVQYQKQAACLVNFQ